MKRSKAHGSQQTHRPLHCLSVAAVELQACFPLKEIPKRQAGHSEKTQRPFSTSQGLLLCPGRCDWNGRHTEVVVPKGHLQARLQVTASRADPRPLQELPVPRPSSGDPERLYNMREMKISRNHVNWLSFGPVPSSGCLRGAAV